VTIGDEIGRFVGAAVPGLTLAGIAVRAVICLAVGAAVIFGIWWVFFSGSAARSKHDTVQAQGQEAITKAGQQAGAAAIPIINNNFYGQQKTDRQTQENQRAILQAPGAGQPVDPALALVGRRSVCLRASARSLPDCQHLLGTGP
jgi:hypothetical protein